MGIHPKLQLKVNELKQAMSDRGWTVDMFEGYRSFERQQQLYNQGRTTPGKIVTHAKPGQGLHNYGLAADMVFKVDGKWSWAERLPWKVLGEEGKKLGLTWGGDFKKIKDFPHMEYTGGLSLKEVKEIYAKVGLIGLWSKIL